MDLTKYIAVQPNWPKPGVSFKDITTLINDGEAYAYAIDEMAKLAKEMKADIIISPESRGFIFGCPVATKLGIGFAPVRKKGKLPRETIEYTYQLEYGTDTLTMHKDAIKKGQRVVIIDDIVAIGGTLEACKALAEQLGGEVVGMISLMGLTALPGVEKFKPFNLKCLILDDVKDE